MWHVSSIANNLSRIVYKFAVSSTCAPLRTYCAWEWVTTRLHRPQVANDKKESIRHANFFASRLLLWIKTSIDGNIYVLHSVRQASAEFKTRSDRKKRCLLSPEKQLESQVIAAVYSALFPRVLGTIGRCDKQTVFRFFFFLCFSACRRLSML